MWSLRYFNYFWFCSDCNNFLCWFFSYYCWSVLCHSSVCWIHCVGCSCCFFPFYSRLCSFSIIFIFCIIFYITCCIWNWCFNYFWFGSDCNNFLCWFFSYYCWSVLGHSSCVWIHCVGCSCCFFPFYSRLGSFSVIFIFCIVFYITCCIWNWCFNYFWFCSDCNNFLCWFFSYYCWSVLCYSSCIWIHCVGCSCCFFPFYSRLGSFSIIFIFCIIFYITCCIWNWCFLYFWLCSLLNNTSYRVCCY